MNVFISYLIIFIFGLVIASFLNVVTYRLKEGKSFIKGRSFCPQCQHPLGAKDLIPLLSFLFQRGKCRYCGKNISWQYPLVEFFLALAFCLLFFRFGWSLKFIFYLVEACFLAVIFVYDIKYHLILDKVSIPAVVLAFIFSLILKISPLDLLIGGIVGSGFFLLQFLVSRGKWIGGGDIRLGALMGFILGWKNLLLALFIAYFSGAIISLILLASRKRNLKSRLAFGPFLVVGTFISLLAGSQIIDWYLAGGLVNWYFH